MSVCVYLCRCGGVGCTVHGSYDVVRLGPQYVDDKCVAVMKCYSSWCVLHKIHPSRKPANRQAHTLTHTLYSQLYTALHSLTHSLRLGALQIMCVR